MLDVDDSFPALRRWIERAIETAKFGHGKHKLGAVCLSKSGDFLSSACNTHKTHPVQASYANRAGLSIKQSLHAEIRALLRAQSPVHTLIVVRVNRRGQLRLAMPCSICMEAIKEAGVEDVLYSGWETMESMNHV